MLWCERVQVTPPNTTVDTKLDSIFPASPLQARLSRRTCSRPLRAVSGDIPDFRKGPQWSNDHPEAAISGCRHADFIGSVPLVARSTWWTPLLLQVAGRLHISVSTPVRGLMATIDVTLGLRITTGYSICAHTDATRTDLSCRTRTRPLAPAAKFSEAAFHASAVSRSRAAHARRSIPALTIRISSVTPPFLTAQSSATWWPPISRVQKTASSGRVARSPGARPFPRSGAVNSLPRVRPASIHRQDASPNNTVPAAAGNVDPHQIHDAFPMRSTEETRPPEGRSARACRARAAEANAGFSAVAQRFHASEPRDPADLVRVHMKLHWYGPAPRCIATPDQAILAKWRERARHADPRPSG